MKGEEERVSKGRGSLNPSFILTSSQPRQSIAAKWALEMKAFLYVPLQSSQSQREGRMGHLQAVQEMHTWQIWS